MKPGVHLTKVWFDDDMMELKIDVSDGISSFSNRVYVGYSAFADVVAQLDAFKDHIHGGLLDIRFGEFGPEYANGAFHAMLHSQNQADSTSVPNSSRSLESFQSRRWPARRRFT